MRAFFIFLIVLVAAVGCSEMPSEPPAPTPEAVVEVDVDVDAMLAKAQALASSSSPAIAKAGGGVVVASYQHLVTAGERAAVRNDSLQVFFVGPRWNFLFWGRATGPRERIYEALISSEEGWALYRWETTGFAPVDVPSWGTTAVGDIAVFSGKMHPGGVAAVLTVWFDPRIAPSVQ